jgi:hypothetical protein
MAHKMCGVTPAYLMSKPSQVTVVWKRGETIGGLGVLVTNFSCSTISSSYGLSVSTFSALWVRLTRDTHTERKVHIWKPFAFRKCSLFQPLTVIFTGVINDRVQREEGHLWFQRANMWKMYMCEGTERKNKCMSATSIVIHLLKYWISHHIP